LLINLSFQKERSPVGLQFVTIIGRNILNTI